MKNTTKVLMAAAIAGAFAARPALANTVATDQAPGYHSVGDKDACSGKEGCKSQDKSKESCKGKESCKAKDKSKESCQSKESCKGKEDSQGKLSLA